MSLMKRLRAPALSLMLSAATMLPFSGCMTVTPWQNVRTEEMPTGSERIESKNIGTKNADKRTFNISDAYLEGETYKTKITESLKRAKYDIQEQEKIRGMKQIATEQREEKEDVFTPIILMGGITIGGVGGGFLFGSENSMGGRSLSAGGALLGGLVGFLGSAAIIGASNVQPRTTKIETRRVESSAKEVSSRQGTDEIFNAESWVYTNQPKQIKFGVVGNSQIYTTDNNGIISKVYSGKNTSATRQGLERKLFDIPLVQEIKPETRGILREKLLGAISNANEIITIETRETPSNSSETVENCKKGLKLNYFQLNDEAIYRVVQQFVDEEINSAMKTLNFKVKDDLTHVPIRGTNFEFATDSPSKSDLSGKYFTGGLKVYAEKLIKDYLFGEGIIQSPSDAFEWKVYSPSNIFLEITHPDYNFVTGEIAIDGNAKRTAYMIDKGSKVRIQNTKEIIGRIEE